MLKGFTVLDMTDALGAPLARILDSFGATMIRCEPDAPPGPDRLRGADFLIESLAPATRTSFGLDHAGVQVVNPRLIQTSITPFGLDGPLSGYRAGELVLSAMGGCLRSVGYPDRAPVKEALDACIFHAACVAAAGTMAAHYERGGSGRGQQVDVSIQEVGFSRNTNGVLVWQFDRRKLHRSGYALAYGVATVRCVWELADGYCFHTLMTGRLGAPANGALSRWMSEAGFDNPMIDVDWLAYNRSTLPAQTRAIWETALDRFFRSRTKEEIREEGRRRGVNAAVANEPDDILNDPHLRARGYWRELALADGRVVEMPAYFVKTDAGRAA